MFNVRVKLKLKQFNFIVHFIALFLLSIFLTGCFCHDAHSLSLDRSIAEKSMVLTFATEAAVSAYTYNYSTYQQDFLSTSQYFTPEGWNYFRIALTQSRNLETVIKKKMMVSAVATDPPVIISEGLLAGRYVWNIHIPLLVVYQNNKEVIKRNVSANLTVVRMPQTVGARGLGVQRFIVI